MIFEGVINPLSIGNVSYNFAKELYELGQLDGYFCISDNFDFSAYNPSDEFIAEMVRLKNESLKSLSRDQTTLKCWHIHGSEKRLTDKQALYTFYEVDSPTEEEVSIVKMQDHVFFSSEESAEYFRKKGCDNVSYVPLGFDTTFAATDLPNRKDPNKIHFILVGKFEKRKNTERIIKLWTEKYGNNNKYQLTCLITNPLLPKEYIQQINQSLFDGKIISNINLHPPLTTNREVAMIHQSADIDLSGLSNGEGWGLPAFNSACLGKWSVVTDCAGHKGWATKDNCVLVSTKGKQPCYDGIFFHEGAKFNQGSYYRVTDQDILDGMGIAVDYVNGERKNEAGLEMQNTFTYRQAVETMLERLA